MRRRTVAAAAAVTGLLLAGCGSSEDKAPPVAVDSTSSAVPTPDATVSSAPGGAVDPASVGANELGKVPVMMYHVVKADPKGEYDQSPAEFKAELERLYRENYRPITALDFINGKIDLPAGKHPVVLTFDDSTESQAKILPDGTPDPNTALGMMEAFEQQYPEWKSTATFYVNNTMFGDDKVIPWLVQNGYEVGSHTANHYNLKTLSDSKVQEEIATNVAKIELQAGNGYKVKTFARPLGIAPVNGELAKAGSFGGTSYSFVGVMLVGSDPSVSVFASKFDPFYIHRIRSGLGNVQLDSNYWLDQMAKSPSTIYTSDGDPNKISFPKSEEAKLNPKYASQANAYEATGSTATSSPSTTPMTSTAPSTAATTTPTSTP